MMSSSPYLNSCFNIVIIKILKVFLTFIYTPSAITSFTLFFFFKAFFYQSFYSTTPLYVHLFTRNIWGYSLLFLNISKGTYMYFQITFSYIPLVAQQPFSSSICNLDTTKLSQPMTCRFPFCCYL